MTSAEFSPLEDVPPETEWFAKIDNSYTRRTYRNDQLGQPEAQLDLAVMYARSEDVSESKVYAHAWASLAGQSGNSNGMVLAEQLEPDLTLTSLRISSDIQSKYSQAALNARLTPHFLKGREYEDRDPVRPSKPFIPEYPTDEARRAIQGEGYVEFVVASDGHPRVPRVLYAVSSGYLEGIVRESVLRSVYLRARINGQLTGDSWFRRKN